MYRTTAVYLSGAVCGSLWWPTGVLAGRPIKVDATGPWGFLRDGDSFRDALDSLLMREGGDFSGAQFSADSEIVIERRRIEGPGKYSIHVKRIELAKIAPDLVNVDAYASDFFGEEE